MSEPKTKPQTHAKQFLVKLECPVPDTFIMRAISDALYQYESASKIQVMRAEEEIEFVKKELTDLIEIKEEEIKRLEGRLKATQQILNEFPEKLIAMYPFMQINNPKKYKRIIAFAQKKIERLREASQK